MKLSGWYYCSVFVLLSAVGADAINIPIGIIIGVTCTAAACVPILITCTCACCCSLIYKSLKTNQKPSNTFIIQQSQLEFGQLPLELQQQLSVNPSFITHNQTLAEQQSTRSSIIQTTVPSHNEERHSANRPLPKLPSVANKSATRSAQEYAGHNEPFDSNEDADGYMLSDNRSLPTITVTEISNDVSTNRSGLLTTNQSKLTRETHSSIRLHKSAELYASIENDYMSVIN